MRTRTTLGPPPVWAARLLEEAAMRGRRTEDRPLTVFEEASLIEDAAEDRVTDLIEQGRHREAEAVREGARRAAAQFTSERLGTAEPEAPAWAVDLAEAAGWSSSPVLSAECFAEDLRESAGAPERGWLADLREAGLDVDLLLAEARR